MTGDELVPTYEGFSEGLVSSNSRRQSSDRKSTFKHARTLLCLRGRGRRVRPPDARLTRDDAHREVGETMVRQKPLAAVRSDAEAADRSTAFFAIVRGFGVFALAPVAAHRGGGPHGSSLKNVHDVR